MPAIIQNETVYGAPVPVPINDNSTSTDEVWSANKSSTETTAIKNKLDTLFKTKPYTVTTSQAGFVRTDLDGNYYIISAKTANNNADNAIELSPVYDKVHNLWFIKVRDTSGNVKGNANVSIEVCYIKLS